MADIVIYLTLTSLLIAAGALPVWMAFSGASSQQRMELAYLRYRYGSRSR